MSSTCISLEYPRGDKINIEIDEFIVSVTDMNSSAYLVYGLSVEYTEIFNMRLATIQG